MSGVAFRPAPLLRMEQESTQSDAASDPVRTWERKASLTRRWLARIGLQGKLILCFMYMLALALGISCWLFARQPNILPLTLGQAVLGGLVWWAFPLAWHHSMRVGPGYYAFNNHLW